MTMLEYSPDSRLHAKVWQDTICSAIMLTAAKAGPRGSIAAGGLHPLISCPAPKESSEAPGDKSVDVVVSAEVDDDPA